MGEEFFHQAPIQLEKDEKRTILSQKKSYLPAVVELIDIYQI